jgi:hypothetical protein
LSNKQGKDGKFTIISDDFALDKFGHAIREAIAFEDTTRNQQEETQEWKQKH